MHRRAILAAIALSFAVFTGASLLTAPSASAAIWVGQSIYACGSGSALCGEGAVYTNGIAVQACDTYHDGIGFRTIYLRDSGLIGYIDDANGSASGCTTLNRGTFGDPIVAFRVAWKNPAAWVYEPSRTGWIRID